MGFKNAEWSTIPVDYLVADCAMSVQYTWDKALERWVKSVGIGQDRSKAPTIQSPKDYCKRFRSAMASYFTCVPAEGDVPAPLDVAAGLPGIGRQTA